MHDTLLFIHFLLCSLNLQLLSDGAISSFSPSIVTINNSIEFNVPINADVRISYFNDAGVLISSSRVVTQDVLDSAISALMEKISSLNASSQAINAEAARAKIEEAVLSSAILQESSDLFSESSSRSSADVTQRSDLVIETSNRVVGDAILTSAAILEQNARSSAVYSLNSTLIYETSVRINADMTITNDLFTESSRAQDKEAALTLMDKTFVSTQNLSVLNSYMNGIIVAATICQTVPGNPLLYGSHDHCAGTVNGFTCSPVCVSGFTASSTLSCVAGVWSGISSCSPNPCNSSPITPAFGNVSMCINKPNGTTCDPVCNLGYINQSGLVCIRGNWTGSSTCSPLPCPTLNVPSNGLLNGDVIPISNGVTANVVSFSCTTGFSRNGPTTATCQATSLWTTSPTCFPTPKVTCTGLGVTQTGSVFTAGKCVFRYNSALTLQNLPTISATGQFSLAVEVCKE